MKNKEFLLLLFLLSMKTVCSADLSTMFFRFLTDVTGPKPVKQPVYDHRSLGGTPELIISAGYPLEQHKVETEDGFILTLHRIPGSKNTKPVFLQHGLLGSSADWVMTGKGKALAYILHDEGYDVWLGNARGNTYSRRHKHLSIKDKKFWDFSFHEMGTLDLPAVINYIKKLKGKKIVYIGHSMGTTMFYVHASELSKVSKEIKMMISLAPVAFVNHMKSPIRFVAPFSGNIQWIIEHFGDGEFLPQSRILKILSKLGCELDMNEEKICANSMFLICGFDKQQFNYTLLPVILDNTPAGTSTKTLEHFAQEIISQKFRQYDYGESKNMKIYGSPDPPNYDLSQIRVPIKLFYADNDWLASTIDVKRLADNLNPKLVDMFKVNFTKFNHLDFIYGIDAPKLVYTKILHIIKEDSTTNSESNTL